MGKHTFLIAVIFIGTVLIILSCGKDRDKPPPEPPPQDSIPVTKDSTDTIFTPSAAHWIKATTPSTTTGIEDIFFADSLTGYVAGSVGEIWKSADGGYSWLQVTVLPSFAPLNLAVTPDGKVFVASRYSGDTIYKSMDGNTFTRQVVDTARINALLLADVYFTGNDTGFISDATTASVPPPNTGLWSTTNGGQSWQFIPLSNYASPFEEFAFYRGQGYMAASNHIFSNGGIYNQWVPYPHSFTPIQGISAPANGVVCFFEKGQRSMFRSTDGGNTFVQSGSLPPMADSTSYLNLHFIDNDTGYVSQGHYIYKTIDGGSTWALNFTSPEQLTEIHFTDARHGWACGANGTVLVYKP